MNNLGPTKGSLLSEQRRLGPSQVHIKSVKSVKSGLQVGAGHNRSFSPEKEIRSRKAANWS